MPTIQIISDVHKRWDQVTPSSSAQIIVALGDISEGSEGVDWLASMNKPVIYIPGNHEYYGTDLGNTIKNLKKRAENSQVRIADCETITAGTTRFLCATLWTDHNSLDADLMAHSLNSLNDYRNIKTVELFKNLEFSDQYDELLSEFEANSPAHRNLFSTRPDKMNPLVGLVLHQRALNYLANELTKSWQGKTIILSHHAPSLASLQFAGYFTTTNTRKFPQVFSQKNKPHKIGSYASSLDYLFSNHRIDMWLHGHLHEGLRYTINGTDVITNPTGYNDLQNKKYKKTLVLDTNDTLRHKKILCLTIYQSLANQSEYSSLVKRCIMNDEKTSKAIFETTDDFICFAKLYNQAIAPLLQQSNKDRNRPEYILEPLNIHRIFANQPDTSQVLDISQRMRYLHEMLSKITANETKSRDWNISIQSSAELSNWTIEGDI